MDSYDQQYQEESALFGAPYPEFEAFVKQHASPGGTALDLGCGQGRDALMLAAHGYTVTGVDSSKVGVEQMVARAAALGLPVQGIVADLFDFQPPASYDAVVLDSILHFAKADKAKEVALLDALVGHINPQGYLFLFVHRSKQKERELHAWFKRVEAHFSIAQQGYINYTYHETVSGFTQSFQYFMFVLKRS